MKLNQQYGSYYIDIFKKYDNNTQQVHNNKASHLQDELNKRFGGSTQVAGQTQDIIAPFVPSFNMVTIILNQMLLIYENAKYSDKKCAALLGCVKIAQEAVRSLQCELQANEENLEIMTINMIGLNLFLLWRILRTIYDVEQRDIEAKNVAKDFEILEK
ncbi:11108_t:CDS:2, partial [Dentiscutata erythropus]